MLKNLVNKRNLIILLFGGILLVLWLLSLIFGRSEDKVMILILTPILSIVIYGFARLLFKILSRNASAKILHIFACFFLIVGTLGIVMMLVEFVSGFPNGLSPTLGGCMGLVVGVLTEAKK